MSDEKIEWAEIDPSIAEDLLNNFSANRKSSQTIIDKYARAMKDGKWHKLGEPVCVTPDGQTLNGMHRLKAIIESGCTITLPVIWNVPVDAMPQIDTGLTRSYNHVRQFHGDPNAAGLAAVVRRMWYWDRGSYYMPNSIGLDKITPSHDELDAYLAEHPEIRSFVNSVKATPIPKMPLSTATVARMIFSRVNAQAEAEFFISWQTGANLTPGSPILALRERLIRDVELSARRTGAEVKLTLACIAWNHWRRSRPLTRILPPRAGITNENYPLPI